MNLTYSRSCFGPNQHSEGAAVYLAITLDAAESETLEVSPLVTQRYSSRLRHGDQTRTRKKYPG